MADRTRDGDLGNEVAARVGEKIKRIRTMKGMTQDQLGRRIGAHDGAMIRHWESGRRIPSVVNIVRMALVFNINPGGLLPDTWHISFAMLQKRGCPND